MTRQPIAGQTTFQLTGKTEVEGKTAADLYNVKLTMSEITIIQKSLKLQLVQTVTNAENSFGGSALLLYKFAKKVEDLQFKMDWIF